MSGSLFLGDFHPDLEAAFARRVRELCPDGDARRLRVVVPNRLLAVHLRRRTAELGVATLGLEPRAIEDLTSELARPVLAQDGWRELPGWALPMLMEEMTGKRARRGYFKAIADLPGLYDALAATLRDVRDGDISIDALEAAAASAGGGRKLNDLIALLRLGSEGLQNRRVADMARVADAAVRALRDAPAAGPLLVYGAYDLLPRQRRVVAALAEGRSCDVFLPWDDTKAFDYARPLKEWFEALGLQPVPPPQREVPSMNRLGALRRALFTPAGPCGPPDQSVRMISVPHPEREALAILRALSDAPATSALVLLRREADTADRLRGAARRARLPLHVAAQSLADRPAGRVALLLVELAELGSKRPASDGQTRPRMLPRVSVEDLLGSGALRPSLFEERSNPGRWAQILRRRGIVARRSDWETLVERYADDGPQARLPFVEAEGGEEDRFLDSRLRRERPLLARWVKRLLHEVDHLGPQLRGGVTAWRGATATITDLLTRWLEPGPDAVAVVAAAAACAELEGVVKLTPGRALAALRQALAATASSAGPRFGAAATVSSLAAARGVTADRVLVPDLVEGSFPRRPREDALLLDEERLALNAALPAGTRLPLQVAASLPEERLLFRLAVGAARRELVLLWPRGLDGGREVVPSSFVLETARALLGTDVDFRGLYEQAAKLDLEVVALTPVYPQTGGDASMLVPSEWDLRAVDAVRSGVRPAGSLGYLKQAYARLGPALVAESARRGEALSAFDGCVGTALGQGYLATLSGAAGREGVRLSASRLQSYARCGFRFFLDGALQARSEPAPERFLDLGAGDLGTLYHDVLHEVYRLLASERALPLTSKTVGRAREILDGVLDRDDFGEDEAPEPLRRARRHRMREDLGGFLAEQASEGTAWRPRAFEVELGTETALTVEIGRRKLRLAGRVDRIDEGANGLRIVDYKTGKLGKEGYPEPPSLLGGRNLQLAYYERALRADQVTKGEAPPGTPIHAAYLGVSAASGFRQVAWEPHHFERARAELERVVEGVVGGMERGEFFQVENNTFCNQQCDFGNLCGPGRASLIARKEADERAARAAEWRSGTGFPSLGDASGESE
ncbi:MAG: PD-(D/E)XK nuclease family protein [Acidobacteriota bacterium]